MKIFEDFIDSIDDRDELMSTSLSVDDIAAKTYLKTDDIDYDFMICAYIDDIRDTYKKSGWYIIKYLESNYYIKDYRFFVIGSGRYTIEETPDKLSMFSIEIVCKFPTLLTLFRFTVMMYNAGFRSYNIYRPPFAIPLAFTNPNTVRFVMTNSDMDFSKSQHWPGAKKVLCQYINWMIPGNVKVIKDFLDMTNSENYMILNDFFNSALARQGFIEDYLPVRLRRIIREQTLDIKKTHEYSLFSKSLPGDPDNMKFILEPDKKNEIIHQLVNKEVKVTHFKVAVSKNRAVFWTYLGMFSLGKAQEVFEIIFSMYGTTNDNQFMNRLGDLFPNMSKDEVQEIMDVLKPKQTTEDL